MGDNFVPMRLNSSVLWRYNLWLLRSSERTSSDGSLTNKHSTSWSNNSAILIDNLVLTLWRWRRGLLTREGLETNNWTTMSRAELNLLWLANGSLEGVPKVLHGVLNISDEEEAKFNLGTIGKHDFQVGVAKILSVIINGAPMRDIRELDLGVNMRSAILEGNVFIGNHECTVVWSELRREVLSTTNESDIEDIATFVDVLKSEIHASTVSRRARFIRAFVKLSSNRSHLLKGWELALREAGEVRSLSLERLRLGSTGKHTDVSRRWNFDTAIRVGDGMETFLDFTLELNGVTHNKDDMGEGTMRAEIELDLRIRVIPRESGNLDGETQKSEKQDS